MGEVIKFPEKPQEHDASVAFGGVWTCGCDAQEWRLYGNGIVLCTGCNYISTVLMVVHNPVPPSAEKASAPPSFDCPRCGTAFPTERGMRIHLGRHCTAPMAATRVGYECQLSAPLDDGFGNSWERCVLGDSCRMEIVRPGKVQCDCFESDQNGGVAQP